MAVSGPGWEGIDLEWWRRNGERVHQEHWNRLEAEAAAREAAAAAENNDPTPPP